MLFSRIRTVWKESAQQVHPDLQPAGYKLLSAITRLGTANAHVLAEMFDMDKSVVSRQIRMLEDLGLVETRIDGRDGRVRVLVRHAQASSSCRACATATSSGCATCSPAAPRPSCELRGSAPEHRQRLTPARGSNEDGPPPEDGPSSHPPLSSSPPLLEVPRQRLARRIGSPHDPHRRDRHPHGHR